MQAWARFCCLTLLTLVRASSQVTAPTCKDIQAAPGVDWESDFNLVLERKTCAQLGWSAEDETTLITLGKKLPQWFISSQVESIAQGNSGQGQKLNVLLHIANVLVTALDKLANPCRRSSASNGMQASFLSTETLAATQVERRTLPIDAQVICGHAQACCACGGGTTMEVNRFPQVLDALHRFYQVLVSCCC